jgi:hypothetical protein
MESAVTRSKSSSADRINFRLITLAALIFLLVGYPVYLYVDAAVNHGVDRIGNLNVVDLKSLGNFPFNDASGGINDVPAIYRALDGKKVALEGFPYPTNNSADEVPEFEIVYNIAKCCFGGPPKVQERVYVHTRDGSSVPAYFYRYSSVEGTLHVEAHKEGGLVTSLYTLELDKVSPVQ